MKVIPSRFVWFALGVMFGSGVRAQESWLIIVALAGVFLVRRLEKGGARK